MNILCVINDYLVFPFFSKENKKKHIIQLWNDLQKSRKENSASVLKSYNGLILLNSF